MNAAQKHALRPRQLGDPSDVMTKDEAKHILNWWFGSINLSRLVGDGASYSNGVVDAIHLLGGKYQPGWGITKLPNYQPFDEI